MATLNNIKRSKHPKEIDIGDPVTIVYDDRNFYIEYDYVRAAIAVRLVFKRTGEIREYPRGSVEKRLDEYISVNEYTDNVRAPGELLRLYALRQAVNDMIKEYTG